MHGELENLYYELHYDRRSWAELAPQEKERVFSVFAKRDVRSRELGRKCIEEALRMDPMPVFQALPDSCKKHFVQAFLERVGARGLLAITPEAWNERAHKRIRREAVAYAIRVSPRKYDIARFLTPSDFADPAIQHHLEALCLDFHEPLLPFLNALPPSVLQTNAALFDAVLQRDMRLIRVLGPDICGPHAARLCRDKAFLARCTGSEKAFLQSLAQHRPPSESLLPKELNPHAEDEKNGRTIFMLQGKRGRQRFWEIGPSGERLGTIPSSALTHTERHSLALAPEKACLGLIRGTCAFFCGIQDALRHARHVLVHFRENWRAASGAVFGKGSMEAVKTSFERVRIALLRSSWMRAAEGMILIGMLHGHELSLHDKEASRTKERKSEKSAESVEGECMQDTEKGPSPLGSARKEGRRGSPFLAAMLPLLFHAVEEEKRVLALDTEKLSALSPKARTMLLLLCRNPEQSVDSLSEQALSLPEKEAEELFFELLDFRRMSFPTTLALCKRLLGDAQDEKESLEHTILAKSRVLPRTERTRLYTALLGSHPESLPLLAEALCYEGYKGERMLEDNIPHREHMVQ